MSWPLVCISVSAAILIYVFGGYPALVSLWSRLRPYRIAPSASGAGWPSVSIVISTRDSAEEVHQRLVNLTELQYPGTVEVLVGADAAPDAYQAASAFTALPVRAWDLPRSGKARVQNLLIAEAIGEIIVTTDVQTRFQPDFLQIVTDLLRRPGIGGVTGVMTIINHDQSGTATNEASYWSFEQTLRQRESDAGLLVGVVGACFAFRRSLFRPINPASDTDNMTPLHIVEAGFKVVQASSARVTEEAISTTRGQLKNRRRTVTRSFVDYLRVPRLLNPFRYPRACIAILSHKLFRWMTPYWLLLGTVGLIEEVYLFHSVLATGLVLAEMFVLLAGVIGIARASKSPLPSWWAACSSLVAVNWAFLTGTLAAASGKRIEKW